MLAAMAFAFLLNLFCEQTSLRQTLVTTKTNEIIQANREFNSGVQMDSRENGK
jgi:hypothetical protein